MLACGCLLEESSAVERTQEHLICCVNTLLAVDSISDDRSIAFMRLVYSNIDWVFINSTFPPFSGMLISNTISSKRQYFINIWMSVRKFTRKCAAA